MPEDPFPQATQEFQPDWVEEDDDVAWEVARAGARPVSRETAPPPPPRRPRAATRRPVPPRGPRTTLSNPRSNGRRPAGAPRGRFPRRILAVLALALIGGALWLINATFQPFHGDPNGAVVVTVPSGADAGEIGKLLESAGVIDNAKLFEANATVTLRRSKLRPGKYTLPQGHDQRRRHRGAHAGPEGEGGQDLQVHAARGPLAARERAAGQEGPVRGRLPEGDDRQGLPAPRARARAAAEGEEPRGLPVPRDLRDDLRRERQGPREAPARRLRAERRQGVR